MIRKNYSDLDLLERLEIVEKTNNALKAYKTDVDAGHYFRPIELLLGISHTDSDLSGSELVTISSKGSYLSECKNLNLDFTVINRGSAFSTDGAEELLVLEVRLNASISEHDLKILKECVENHFQTELSTVPIKFRPKLFIAYVKPVVEHYIENKEVTEKIVDIYKREKEVTTKYGIVDRVKALKYELAGVTLNDIDYGFKAFELRELLMLCYSLEDVTDVSFKGIEFTLNSLISN